jgi:hypothetical protein
LAPPKAIGLLIRPFVRVDFIFSLKIPYLGGRREHFYMKRNRMSVAVACLFWALLSIPAPASAQCELLQRDIEEVRTYALEVLRVSDTLEVFAHKISSAHNYSAARAHARKAQIYSGEILAATYKAVSMAAEAQQRAELCGTPGVGEYLSKASEEASQARDLADQAFGYAKRAYATRSLETMKSLLEQSVNAVHKAQNAATSVAAAASEAHYCCSPTDLAVAGQGR